MGVGAIYIARKVLDAINLFISMNLFRFVYYENYQLRSLAPVR
jgi:hypothetical protein